MRMEIERSILLHNTRPLWPKLSQRALERGVLILLGFEFYFGRSLLNYGYVARRRSRHRGTKTTIVRSKYESDDEGDDEGADGDAEQSDVPQRESSVREEPWYEAITDELTTEDVPDDTATRCENILETAGHTVGIL